jgi:predicted nucleotidyltransferase component of viral defense system
MKIDLHHIPSSTALLLQTLSREPYMKRFSLVGGTALALQLGHRQSEDLDFVFDGEKIDAIGIKRFIARKFPDYKLIREEKGYQLDFIVNTVKVTFFSTGAVLIPFAVKEHTRSFGTVHIASVKVIASLKIATISQRCTMRDYYDLYFIAKHVVPLSEIYENTKALIPNLAPITYSETIIYTADIPENEVGSHLSPKELVSKDDVAEFFIEEIRKMKIT